MAVDGTGDSTRESSRTEDSTAQQAAEGERSPTAGVSRTTLVVSVLVAIILAGTAGLVIGWKVEQERVKDDVANVRPIGTVTAVDDDSVTIELETASGTRSFRITDETSVEGSEEIEEGSLVLVRSSRGEGDQLEAEQIFVLAPPGS